MTNLATAKNASEVKLKGIKIEFVTIDKAVRSVVLSDGKNSVTIQRKDAYSDHISVLVPQPFDKEDRYHLSGTFGSMLPVSEYFEREYEANQRMGEFEREASSSALTVSRVAVFVDENGTVRGKASDEPATAREMEDDGVPF